MRGGGRLENEMGVEGVTGEVRGGEEMVSAGVSVSVCVFGVGGAADSAVGLQSEL